MNLVQRVDIVDDIPNKLFEKYSDVFDSLGCIINIKFISGVISKHIADS